MKTTQVRLDKETAQVCRRIAAACDYFISRGEGAGETGNIAAMLEGIAQRYRDDPTGTTRVLAVLLNRPRKGV